MEEVGVLYVHLVYVFYGHLVWFTAIWYIFGYLVYSLPPRLGITEKNLATCFAQFWFENRKDLHAQRLRCVFYIQPNLTRYVA
jgi:hypothetical protein